MSKAVRPALKSLTAYLEHPSASSISSSGSSSSGLAQKKLGIPSSLDAGLPRISALTPSPRAAGMVDTPTPPLPLNGLFPVAKPSGMLSMRLVDRISDLLEDSKLFYDKFKIEQKQQGNKRKKNKTEKGFKIGQGGTLDPLADGVLVIGVNRGTKYLQAYLDGTKEYVSTGLLGAATDTMDADGKVLSTAPWEHVTRETIENVLDQFRGKIKQTPPIFSALKMEGKQLYEYARENKPLPRPIPVRECTVSIDLIDFQPASKPGMHHAGHNYRWPEVRLTPEEKQVFTSLTKIVKDAKTEDPTVQAAPMPDVAAEDVPEVSSTGIRPPTFTVRMSVSSGTYVRSLINDIALAIGSAAHVVVLTRTKQGQFSLPEDKADDKKHGISPPSSPEPNKKPHLENGSASSSSSKPFTPSSIAMRWDIWDRAFQERAKMLHDEREEKEAMIAAGKLQPDELREYFSPLRVRERRMAHPLREWEKEMLKHFHPVDVPVSGGPKHEKLWQEKRERATEGTTEEEAANL